MTGKTLHRKTEVRALQRAFAGRSAGTEIAFWLQDWTDAYNVGGMFRVADAVGATELVLSARTPTPESPMVPVTSLGAHRRVPFRHFAHNDDALAVLRAEGYAVVAIELAESAVPYVDYAWPERLCLVLGNEQRGIYGKVMREMDGAVFIPMAGKGRSLNVHVAAAVVAFHIRMLGTSSLGSSQ